MLIFIRLLTAALALISALQFSTVSVRDIIISPAVISFFQWFTITKPISYLLLATPKASHLATQIRNGALASCLGPAGDNINTSYISLIYCNAAQYIASMFDSLTHMAHPKLSSYCECSSPLATFDWIPTPSKPLILDVFFPTRTYPLLRGLSTSAINFLVALFGPCVLCMAVSLVWVFLRSASACNVISEAQSDPDDFHGPARPDKDKNCHHPERTADSEDIQLHRNKSLEHFGFPDVSPRFDVPQEAYHSDSASPTPSEAVLSFLTHSQDVSVDCSEVNGPRTKNLEYVDRGVCTDGFEYTTPPSVLTTLVAGPADSSSIRGRILVCDVHAEENNDLVSVLYARPGSRRARSYSDPGAVMDGLFGQVASVDPAAPLSKLEEFAENLRKNSTTCHAAVSDNALGADNAANSGFVHDDASIPETSSVDDECSASQVILSELTIVTPRDLESTNRQLIYSDSDSLVHDNFGFSGLQAAQPFVYPSSGTPETGSGSDSVAVSSSGNDLTMDTASIPAASESMDDYGDLGLDDLPTSDALSGINGSSEGDMSEDEETFTYPGFVPSTPASTDSTLEQETFVYLGSATSTTTDGDGAANDSIAFNDLDDTHDQSYTDDHEHVQSPVEIKSEEEAIFVKDLREILKAQQVSTQPQEPSASIENQDISLNNELNGRNTEHDDLEQHTTTPGTKSDPRPSEDLTEELPPTLISTPRLDIDTPSEAILPLAALQSFIQLPTSSTTGPMTEPQASQTLNDCAQDERARSTTRTSSECGNQLELSKDGPVHVDFGLDSETDEADVCEILETSLAHTECDSAEVESGNDTANVSSVMDTDMTEQTSEDLEDSSSSLSELDSGEEKLEDQERGIADTEDHHLSQTEVQDDQRHPLPPRPIGGDFSEYVGQTVGPELAATRMRPRPSGNHPEHTATHSIWTPAQHQPTRAVSYGLPHRPAPTLSTSVSQGSVHPSTMIPVFMPPPSGPGLGLSPMRPGIPPSGILPMPMLGPQYVARPPLGPPSMLPPPPPATTPYGIPVMPPVYTVHPGFAQVALSSQRSRHMPPATSPGPYAPPSPIQVAAQRPTVSPLVTFLPPRLVSPMPVAPLTMSPLPRAPLTPTSSSPSTPVPCTAPSSPPYAEREVDVEATGDLESDVLAHQQGGVSQSRWASAPSLPPQTRSPRLSRRRAMTEYQRVRRAQSSDARQTGGSALESKSMLGLGEADAQSSKPGLSASMWA